MSFKDSLKGAVDAVSHQLYVENPSATPKKILTPITPPVVRQPSVSNNTSLPTFSINSVVVDDNIYQQLLAKTNFDTSPVGKIVHKYYDSLDDSDFDSNTKFKMAMKQAAKLDGVAPAQILATFDTLIESLNAENSKFNHTASTIEENEITDRQKQVADLEDQIAKLGQQRIQLMSELASSQTKHANITQQFSMASQKRATEIGQQKAQFAALLSH